MVIGFVIPDDADADSVPPEKVRFAPIVTLEKPPEPLPYKIDVPEVDPPLVAVKVPPERESPLPIVTGAPLPAASCEDVPVNEIEGRTEQTVTPPRIVSLRG